MKVLLQRFVKYTTLLLVGWSLLTLVLARLDKVNVSGGHGLEIYTDLLINIDETSTYVNVLQVVEDELTSDFVWLWPRVKFYISTLHFNCIDGTYFVNIDPFSWQVSRFISPTAVEFKRGSTLGTSLSRDQIEYTLVTYSRTRVKNVMDHWIRSGVAIHEIKVPPEYFIEYMDPNHELCKNNIAKQIEFDMNRHNTGKAFLYGIDDELLYEIEFDFGNGIVGDNTMGGAN